MFIRSESAMEPRAVASVVTDSPPVIKKRKLNSSKDVNEAIVSSLNGLMEFRKQKQQKDEESLYADHIAAVLHRFNPRQKALARVQIDQVLFNIEFPSTES